MQALKYEEDYDAALGCFKRAQELDPTWDAPKCLERTLTKFILDVKVRTNSEYLHSTLSNGFVQQLIDMKGKLKTKRYNAMVQSIEASKGLGPLASCGRKEPLKVVAFSDLSPGIINEGKVVLGKVICSVHSEDAVPL